MTHMQTDTFTNGDATYVIVLDDAGKVLGIAREVHVRFGVRPHLAHTRLRGDKLDAVRKLYEASRQRVECPA